MTKKDKKNGSLKFSRRDFNSLLAGVAIGLKPKFSSASPNPKILIIGGGVGGTIVARHLLVSLPNAKIILVEPNKNYVTPFFTNQYLGGFKPLSDFTHNYEQLKHFKNLTILQDTATYIDPERAQVKFKRSSPMTYDSLVLAPGTSPLFNRIKGYTEDTADFLPHAYSITASNQWLTLRNQIKNMPNGGLLAITAPRRPYRCTPAPYERASLIAKYLKNSKPRSKILILDSKNEFPLMDIVLELWRESYGELIEWVSADFGGAIIAVDKKNKMLFSGDEKFQFNAANIIPPQTAGEIALNSGLTDKTGWCPVDGQTFESILAKNIYILGDAINAGDMPKSASAAVSQAKNVAISLEQAYGVLGNKYNELENSCAFFTDTNSAVIVGGKYRVSNKKIVGVSGYSSEVGEEKSNLINNAKNSRLWYERFIRNAFS